MFTGFICFRCGNKPSVSYVARVVVWLNPVGLTTRWTEYITGVGTFACVPAHLRLYRDTTAKQMLEHQIFAQVAGKQWEAFAEGKEKSTSLCSPPVLRLFKRGGAMFWLCRYQLNWPGRPGASVGSQMFTICHHQLLCLIIRQHFLPPFPLSGPYYKTHTHTHTMFPFWGKMY